MNQIVKRGSQWRLFSVIIPVFNDYFIFLLFNKQNIKLQFKNIIIVIMNRNS
jgi:hypothetical protein